MGFAALRTVLPLAACVLGGCGLLGAAPEREPGFGLGKSELAAVVAELELGRDADVLIAVGDIARCDVLAPAEATAELAAAVVDAAGSALVITLGDHAYESATQQDFERCYEPTWGRFNAITRPTPGNHDFESNEALPYYDYFDWYRRDEPARRRGYYEFRFAGWQILALNSMLPMEAGSQQADWLAGRLAEADADCVLAYWHHPLFSSGRHGVNPWDSGEQSVAAWRLLERSGAELVVNAHEHFYERFVPLASSGEPAPDGIRQFVVGTGGGDLRATVGQRANSARIYKDGYGLLVLILDEGSYRWSFVGTDGAIHDESDGEVHCSR